MTEDKYVPATQWHPVGNGIEWRPYRHWGTRCYAGEGLEIHEGDRSGCIQERRGSLVFCDAPVVVEARIYRIEAREVSAVLSYPGGIGAPPYYFWEIFPLWRNFGIERFETEREMEERVRALLWMT